MGSQPVQRRRTAFALAATIGITLLPYWEVVIGRRSAMYGDVNDFAVPAYVSVWRSITHGRAPWWTPNVFGGHSALGAGQYAIFYPLNVLFGVLSPVTAYRWWLLAHLVIAATGAFAWAWRRFGTHTGAAVCGIAYAGCGFVVLHLLHTPWIIAMAWLPALFCGVDMVRERWSTLRAALVAVPLALISFGGHPQAVWIAVAGVAVYVLTLTFVGKRNVAALARSAAAGALGIGLAAVQLLPLWLFSRTSQRPSLSFADAFNDPVLPRNVLTLVFPWMYGGSSFGSTFSALWRAGNTQHEVGMFAGATIIVLAVVAVVWGRTTPVVWALVAVGVFSLLVSLGASTPFGHIFYDVLPLAKNFRDWGRTMVLLNLALAMLAAAGVSTVLKTPRRFIIVLVLAALAMAVLGIAVANTGPLHKVVVYGRYGLIARGLPVVLLLGLAGAVALMTVHRRAGAYLLVAVCSIEILSFAYVAEWRNLSGPVRDLNSYYDTSVPPGFGRPYNARGGVDRWASDSYGFRMVSLAKNIRSVNGYDPLIQKQWAETVAGFTYDGYPSREDLWNPGWLSDVLRVSTAILNEKRVPADPTWRRVSAVPGLDMVRWEREPRLPEAYLVGEVRVASLSRIRAALVDPATPMLTTAFVERGSQGVGRLNDPGASGSAGRVLSADVLGSGRVVVDAARPSLLVLSHDWERGWHATVDGRSASVLRTNGVVLGIVVPRGHHVVTLGFRPPGLVLGGLVTLLSMGVLVASGPVLRRIRRREPSPAAAT